MANYFSPIDWNSPDAQAEYDKRNAMNAQIDFINQLGQASGGNRQLQNALLGQYLGMVFPEDTSAQDSESQLGIAMDLIASGDPGLTETGRTMLTKNPLLSEYFSGTTQPESGLATEYGQQGTQGLFNQKLQGELEMEKQNPTSDKFKLLQWLSQQTPDTAQKYYEDIDKIGIVGPWDMSKRGIGFDPTKLESWGLTKEGWSAPYLAAYGLGYRR